MIAASTGNPPHPSRPFRPRSRHRRGSPRRVGSSTGPAINNSAPASRGGGGDRKTLFSARPVGDVAHRVDSARALGPAVIGMRRPCSGGDFQARNRVDVPGPFVSSEGETREGRGGVRLRSTRADLRGGSRSHRKSPPVRAAVRARTRRTPSHPRRAPSRHLSPRRWRHCAALPDAATYGHSSRAPRAPACRSRAARGEVVGDARRHLRQQISGRRRDDHQIGLAAQLDMPHLDLVLQVEEIGINLVRKAPRASAASRTARPRASAHSAPSCPPCAAAGRARCFCTVAMPPPMMSRMRGWSSRQNPRGQHVERGDDHILLGLQISDRA